MLSSGIPINSEVTFTLTDHDTGAVETIVRKNKVMLVTRNTIARVFAETITSGNGKDKLSGLSRIFPKGMSFGTGASNSIETDQKLEEELVSASGPARITLVARVVDGSKVLFRGLLEAGSVQAILTEAGLWGLGAEENGTAWSVLVKDSGLLLAHLTGLAIDMRGNKSLGIAWAWDFGGGND